MYCHHSDGEDNVNNVNIIPADVENTSTTCDDNTDADDDDDDIIAWSDNAGSWWQAKPGAEAGGGGRLCAQLSGAYGHVPHPGLLPD